MSARRVVLSFLIVATACDRPLPNAGLVTEDNLALVVPPGDTAGGKPGDYYLRNAHATFIIQRPGREIALGPYGGALIDAALSGGEDRFGELIPVLALGRTVRVDSLRVVADGSDGEPAVIEGVGRDALNVYYNLRATNPELIDGLALLPFRPEDEMNLRVRVRYELAPHEPRLSITYSFENTGSQIQPVPLGFIVDSRGTLEGFVPGAGFATDLVKEISQDNILKLIGLEPTVEQLLYTAPDVTYAIVPRRLGNKSPPRAIGAQVPQLGGVLVLEARSVLDSTQSPAIKLDPGESKDLQVDVLLAKSGSEALARGWSLLGRPLAPVSGCVRTPDGEPVSDVRVGFTHAERGVTSFFTTDASGCFAGQMPPGEYSAVAGTAYRKSSDEVAVSVPGDVELTLEPLGEVALDVLTYDEVDATEPTRAPCRLTLVGERIVTLHPAISNTPVDAVGGVVARQALSRFCSDGVQVPAGNYLAIVTRGPEFDKIERVIEVRAGERTSVDGVLRRVVDSRGYAASDFHVHSVYSSDSVVSASDRVLSLAAEGMDFWASTEHDFVVDYSAAIRALGLASTLSTVPGAEVTTFDLGHFGAYPLPVDPRQSNGGSPDWAVGIHGVRPTMDELFAAIHAKGALVQVNHPRGGGLAIGNYFSRAGLRFSPDTLTPLADATTQRIDSSYLRYPEGTTYFSDDFDVIEVINGVRTFVSGGMVFDRSMESAGHDWMNFLSAGRRVVGVANSDTHSLSRPPGTPRTMVGGHGGGPQSIIAALRRGDAVMTTGPMVRAWLEDPLGSQAGLGEVLSPASREVYLHVQVETPSWYAVDKVEVIANAFFADPEDNTPASPIVRAPLQPEKVVRAHGGEALVAHAVFALNLDAAPFSTRDSWIVVRVGGSKSNLFPVLQGTGVLDTSASTPEQFLHARRSGLPYAVTNPIFIDGDGDGRWL